MTDKIQIETDIPIPERPKNLAAKYPWREMKVGDSFLIPRVNGEPVQAVRERASKAIQYARKFGSKYTIRVGEAGARVWRLE